MRNSVMAMAKQSEKLQRDMQKFLQKIATEKSISNAMRKSIYGSPNPTSVNPLYQWKFRPGNYGIYRSWYKGDSYA